MSAMIAGGLFLIGLGCVVWSLLFGGGTAAVMYSLIAFLLMGVVGVWRCVEILEDIQRKEK